MKKIYFGLFVLPSLIFGQAGNYYNGTENLTGYQLKSKLHDIISNKPISWNYGDLPTFYATTDVDRYYEKDGSLLDIYSEIPDGPDAYEYNFDQMIGSAAAEGLGWNREHMMPQSTFNSYYPMYSDLFFVVPTDARINQLRSNYPYGVVGSTIYYTFTNSSRIGNCAIPNATYKGRVYEPINEFKGDVARALLYYAVRYEGKLGSFNFDTNADPTKDQNPMNGTEEQAFEKWYIQMLINWHNADPVSQKEIERNNYVYQIQKNRNPFIDHPEWVNSIWNQNIATTAPQGVSDLATTKTSAYFSSLQWTPSQDPTVIGYEVYQDGTLIGKTSSNKFVADRLTPLTTYNFSVIAYNNAYLKSPQSNMVSTTTLENDAYASDLMIDKYIKGTANNNALEIKNLTGHDVDLKNYRLTAQYKSGANYYFEKPLELEGILQHGQSFVAINPNATLSCYPAANARFQSASPALTFTGYNYVEINYKNFPVDAVGSKGMDNGNANKSLYRLATVQNPTKTYDVSEWQSYPKDYCQNLGSLATQDVSLLANTSIYPNPVSDILNVKSDQVIANFQILDSMGRLVKSGTLNAKNASVNVANLAAGVYFLKLDDKVQQFIKR
ncbi:endonuclease [Soonwooa sp.]|uniref:endonuclease n=1 Tax=Soonwooa sp. TaxID=1938592 RepID=UPI00260AAAE5|nr:endonuclease [Soonwooa sp.]